MLLWINGPFGVGKTQTAYEIRRRLPGSVVCDPEHIGFGLHRTLPPSLRGDFQDLAAWRQGVYEVLDLALRKHGDGPVVVPMTLVEPAYFEEVVGRLREAHGPDRVRHFALLAERGTVLKRLSERGLGGGLKRDSFAVSRLDLCLERLSGPESRTTSVPTGSRSRRSRTRWRVRPDFGSRRTRTGRCVTAYGGCGSACRTSASTEHGPRTQGG